MMKEMARSSYSEEEAEAILRLASRKSMGGFISRDSLLTSAAELGIAPEAVAEAELAFEQGREDFENRAAFDQHRRSSFMNSAAAAVGSAVFMCGVNFFTSGKLDWVYWLLIFWAYQLLHSGWEAFGQRGEAYEKDFQKWLIKRDTGGDLDEEEVKRPKIVVGLHVSRPRREDRVIRLRNSD